MVYTVKYCPMICGQIHTNIVAIGILGVWRATQLDYCSNDDYAYGEMGEEQQPFQPERNNFFITEISCGKFCGEMGGILSISFIRRY